jgi:ribA/ribD-fused uncharacterized protein
MMSERIDRFEGTWYFLSNFSASPVEMDGLIYPTVEHAYQAAKTFNTNNRVKIQKALTPGLAKKLGRKVPMRSDWDDVKISIMENLIEKKFAPGTKLASDLLLTMDAELIEGNWWNDTFWGVCNSKGHNHLGKILMKRRASLKEIQ